MRRAIEASFQQGVLEVDIPKPQESKPRRVEIKAPARGGLSGRRAPRAQAERPLRSSPGRACGRASCAWLRRCITTPLTIANATATSP